MNQAAPIPAGAADLDARLAGLDDPAIAYARFAADITVDAIPAAVRARAAHHILDAAGIALASAKYDFAQRTLNAISGLAGPGPVPVIGLPARLPARDAATVNGLLCHGLDFDDTHLGGVVHPTSSVFPAALSAGMTTGASGADVLTAYIVGVETAARIGAVAKGGFHQVGFHPTGVAGAFACAITAGMLFGLTAREMASAQGIVLSLASGSLEFLEDGAWNKRLHPGWAAAAGLTAAALAKQGFVGATRPYFGRFGLYRSHLGPLAEACDYGLATAGLGAVWEVTGTAIKPYPACHFTHAAIDAALDLRGQGVTPDTLARIQVLVPGEVVKTVCEPEANKKRPANGYDAQFSIPYLVAAAFVHGRVGLGEVEEPALKDAAVLALAEKVDYRVDPDSPFPRAYSGEVIATLVDGRVLRVREAINRGAPERPLSDADIIAKFRGNAALSVSPAAARRVEAAVLGMDTAAPVAALAGALSA